MPDDKGKRRKSKAAELRRKRDRYLSNIAIERELLATRERMLDRAVPILGDIEAMLGHHRSKAVQAALKDVEHSIRRIAMQQRSALHIATWQRRVAEIERKLHAEAVCSGHRRDARRG